MSFSPGTIESLKSLLLDRFLKLALILVGSETARRSWSAILLLAGRTAISTLRRVLALRRWSAIASLLAWSRAALKKKKKSQHGMSLVTTIWTQGDATNVSVAARWPLLLRVRRVLVRRLII